MNSDEELFGLSSSEADTVSKLAESVLGHNRSLEEALKFCKSEGMSLCLRSHVASIALASFLMSDGSSSPEELMDELGALRQHVEILKTPVCLKMAQELVAMDIVLIAGAAHGDEGLIAEANDQDNPLANFFREGDLDSPEFQAAWTLFIQSLEEVSGEE